MELAKFLPVHQNSVDIFFPYSVFSGLGPGLWSLGLLCVPLVLINRLNKTESAVFLDYRFSLFPDYL